MNNMKEHLPFIAMIISVMFSIVGMVLGITISFILTPICVIFGWLIMISLLIYNRYLDNKR